jgi:uroporphyrinogen-III synthase
MLRPTVVVTRPEPESAAWVQELGAAGWPALALPLLRLAPADGAQSLHAVWHQAQHFQAWMFVSAAAVRFFFASCPADWRPTAPLPRSWAPGPGTAQALRRAWAQLGVPDAPVDEPAADAPQFDSEALWARVSAQVRPGFRLLLVRGDSDTPQRDEAGRAVAGGVLPGVGRDWLTQHSLARGADVQAVVAYERRLRTWSDPADAQALQHALALPLWQLSNREALHALAAVPAQQWGNKTAIVTHPRIAQAAQDVGFGRVLHCEPGVPALIAALKSLTP